MSRLNPEIKEKILEYIKTHHHSENDVSSISKAVGRSKASTRYIMAALEESGEIARYSRKFGNTSVFITRG